ncbi:MAG: CocE/NonD family hydrolase [Devosia sp.]|nr:CocE/NonD family hydrolase [Devosia sp.]
MLADERLEDVAPELARIVGRPQILTPAIYGAAQIKIETVMAPMRDGVRLATDLYLPPRLPAPVIAVRTPYGRGADAWAGDALSLARRGYAVVCQDCRGTGDSEPDQWNYYLDEPQDSYDLVEWIAAQDWCDGFIGACGGSYAGQVQWQMATHPKMSAIAPDVSGLGVAINTARLHMFANAYARAIGKGEDKVDVPLPELEARMLEETLATGYFNEPLRPAPPGALVRRFPQLAGMDHGEAQRWLWDRYCAMPCAERVALVKAALGVTAVTVVDVEALSTVFGQRISHDAHTLPHPDPTRLCGQFHAPPLMRTGWYDWGLNDALATWRLLRDHAPEPLRSACRLFIAPSAHAAPGYHEGMAERPELQHAHRGTAGLEMLMQWCAAVRSGDLGDWPRVIYYLMGANAWRAATDWPVPEARPCTLYLAPGGALESRPPTASPPDAYVYDPQDPTPTLGGSILSYVYPAGSVDVSAAQARADVLTFTTAPLAADLDVVGPLTCVLHASSSATDTDFVARLTDVFPDGRAIQLQSALLRARHRDVDAGPTLLEPGRIYRFEIDLWATANRFKAGHRLRLDISSADFPKFDRNANRGGEPGPPIRATQTIHHDREHPSHLAFQVLGAAPEGWG